MGQGFYIKCTVTVIFMQQHAAKGQIVTGLLYVESEPEDLHHNFNTLDAPLKGREWRRRRRMGVPPSGMLGVCCLTRPRPALRINLPLASVADLLRNIVSQTVHISTHVVHAPLLKELLDLAVEGLLLLLGTKPLSEAFELCT
jgi:hypothetical protein